MLRRLGEDGSSADVVTAASDGFGLDVGLPHAFELSRNSEGIKRPKALTLGGFSVN